MLGASITLLLSSAATGAVSLGMLRKAGTQEEALPVLRLTFSASIAGGAAAVLMLTFILINPMWA